MDLALPPHMDEFAIEAFIGREVEGEVYERTSDLVGLGGAAHVEPRARCSGVDQSGRDRCNQKMSATQIVSAALTR
jgi:hypothetical protein